MLMCAEMVVQNSLPNIGTYSGRHRITMRAMVFLARARMLIIVKDKEPFPFTITDFTYSVQFIHLQIIACFRFSAFKEL